MIAGLTEFYEAAEGRAGCGVSAVSERGSGARAPAQCTARPAGGSGARCCGSSCPRQVRPFRLPLLYEVLLVLIEPA